MSWYDVLLARNMGGGGTVDPAVIAEAVTDWLEDNVDPETGYVIDNSLTIAGAAADAKKTGDEVNDLKSAMSAVYNGVIEYTKSEANAAFEKTVAKYIKINVGATLTFSGSSDDTYVLKIPCSGYETITYPLFKSSGGGGSGFVDNNDILISGYSETSASTGTQKTVQVPETAVYFYLSITGALDATDWSIAFTKANFGEIQNILLNNVDHVEITNVSTQCYLTTSGDTFNWTYTASSTYGCICLPCVPGDVFVITGASGSAPRLYAFVDASNNILSSPKAPANASETSKMLVAPATAAYVVFNFHINETWHVYKGLTMEERIRIISDQYYVALNQGAGNYGKYMGVNEEGKVVPVYAGGLGASTVYEWHTLELPFAQSIPVGDSALGYADFIEQTWDTLLTDFPNEVTKTTVINDSSDTYPIYKYVFTPQYYKKTVFLTAGMHGNEYEGFWGLYRFIELIYKHGYRYENLSYLRHNVRFVIIPVLNPYGVQNKTRYNANGVDANRNFDVYWDDPDYSHDGSAPFSENEAKAVKLVADSYTGEIDYHADFHTDPYTPTNGLYIEADGNSPTFETAYNITKDFRMLLKDEYNYTAPLSKNFVVWQNTACSIFRYMEVVQDVPSNIVEVGIGGFAESGTTDAMKTGTAWYANTVISMIKANVAMPDAN